MMRNILRSLVRWNRVYRHTLGLAAMAVAFFLASLSFGLDLWNDNQIGGTSGGTAIDPGFPTFAAGVSSFPQAFDPMGFMKTFQLRSAQRLGNWGRGATIAFFELNGAFDERAYQAFCSQFAREEPQLLPATPPQIIVGGKALASIPKPSRNDGSLIETMMDVEWAHVIAPEAKLLIVDMNHNDAAQVKSLIEHSHVTVISSSLADPWADFAIRNPLLNQFSMIYEHAGLAAWIGTHVPLFVSSGDGGSRIPPEVLVPQSVIVGGVQAGIFSDPRKLASYDVWPDEGRGTAVLNAIASPWQNQVTRIRSLWRQVPDVTWLSFFPYVWYRTTQGWYLGAGTSLAAPSFAALWALADTAHQIAHQGQSLPANANQVLYQMAQSHPQVFHTSHPGQWTHGLGLGFPNPGAFVRTAAAWSQDRVTDGRIGPRIASMPFWILQTGSGAAVAVFFVGVVAGIVLENLPRRGGKRTATSIVMKIAINSGLVWVGMVMIALAAIFVTLVTMEIPLNDGEFFAPPRLFAYSLLTVVMISVTYVLWLKLGRWIRRNTLGAPISDR